GYVGRLIKSKNIRFLLNVFLKYLSIYPKDKLFIFGFGPEEKFISKFIKKYDLSKNIILWGFEKEKSKIYGKINALIHPSLGEGCPNTILESALTETFVIASNVSGIKDIIEHKISGLLFNPFKEENLLKQLLFYKEHQELVHNIIETAKNKVISEYNINVVANQIYNFIKSKWVKKLYKGPLKISVVTPVFPYPNRGIFPGVERYIESLVIPLKKMGNDIKIITCFWNGGLRHDEYEGIPILRILDSKAFFGKIGSIFHLNNITFGLNLIRKKNFKFFNNSDVIIMPLALGFNSFFKIKKIPIISGFLHYDYLSSSMECLTVPFYHYLEKRQFKRHKKIITISNSSKNDITKYYGIEEENIRVFPIGIDIDTFSPSNFSIKIREKFGKKILLYVGPFVKRKRIPILLMAMTYIIKKIPDVHLILIGRGLLWNYCKNLSNSLGIQQNTTFLGFIDNELLIKYYASSDIFIFPSELEGFGQVLLEAMASGTPVICANIPPMSELIEDGGKTFKVNDPKDLSKKIIELFSNREELTKLKRNTINIVKKYDLIEIAKSYIDYFKEIRKRSLNII
ncbi:MAG: glycosyltransferase family 4 protein, partial [Promethearchaeota archaeon]